MWSTIYSIRFCMISVQISYICFSNIKHSYTILWLPIYSSSRPESQWSGIPVQGLAFQSRSWWNFENGRDFCRDLEFKMKAKIHFYDVINICNLQSYFKNINLFCFIASFWFMGFLLVLNVRTKTCINFTIAIFLNNSGHQSRSRPNPHPGQSWSRPKNFNPGPCQSKIHIPVDYWTILLISRILYITPNLFS